MLLQRVLCTQSIAVGGNRTRKISSQTSSGLLEYNGKNHWRLCLNFISIDNVVVVAFENSEFVGTNQEFLGISDRVDIVSVFDGETYFANIFIQR